jgi:hypothetical protein
MKTLTSYLTKKAKWLAVVKSLTAEKEEKSEEITQSQTKKSSQSGRKSLLVITQIEDKTNELMEVFICHFCVYFVDKTSHLCFFCILLLFFQQNVSF